MQCRHSPPSGQSSSIMGCNLIKICSHMQAGIHKGSRRLFLSAMVEQRTQMLRPRCVLVRGGFFSTSATVKQSQCFIRLNEVWIIRGRRNPVFITILLPIFTFKTFTLFIVGNGAPYAVQIVGIHTTVRGPVHNFSQTVLLLSRPLWL